LSSASPQTQVMTKVSWDITITYQLREKWIHILHMCTCVCVSITSLILIFNVIGHILFRWKTRYNWPNSWLSPTNYVSNSCMCMAMWQLLFLLQCCCYNCVMNTVWYLETVSMDMYNILTNHHDKYISTIFLTISFKGW